MKFFCRIRRFFQEDEPTSESSLTPKMHEALTEVAKTQRARYVLESKLESTGFLLGDAALGRERPAREKPRTPNRKAKPHA